MSSGVIILALLGSMMVGVLLAILIDTFYVRRWYDAMQADRMQLDESLRQRTIKLGRAEAQAAALEERLAENGRLLDDLRRENTRLDETRVELETKLETAVAETSDLEAQIARLDSQIDTLREEKQELEKQVSVAEVEMKHLREDVAEARRQLVEMEALEDKNRQLAARLQETEAKAESANVQLEKMKNALKRANAQIKHTGKSQLQIIKGIGPVTERKLKDAGIVTVPDLAEQTPERLREILNLKSSSRAKPEAWVEEARQLAPTFGEADM
jgi:predicted flap endonuclease-1-like 5' DNA nuclease